MSTVQNRKRFWKILITILLIWLVAIPLVLIVVNAIALRPRKRTNETRVPQLVGLDQKTAEAKARAANLSMQVLLTRWDQPGPVGMVLFQTPGPGETVEVGTPIGVSISIEDPDAQFWKEKEEKVAAEAAKTSKPLRPMPQATPGKSQMPPQDIDTTAPCRQ